MLLAASVVVRIIGVFYKIPLTSYIGATGRGYFSIAYNLCLPVHALTMGAFPIALSKLVGKYNAVGDGEKVSALRYASKRLFAVIAFAGLFFMLACAKPYCVIISSAPKSIYTVLALAPSVFFCALGAGRRAFCEGLMDMKPTAVCQVIEALFKLVFGLLFAKMSMSCLLDSYAQSGAVLGVACENEQQALECIYPLTSAASMLGVTLGGLAGYIYVAAYAGSKYRLKRPSDIKIGAAFGELVSFSLPLIFATAVQSIANFADTSAVQYALARCGEDALKTAYNYSGSDVYTYVFGVYSSVLDFKNLVPGIVMALGVSAVPALSGAYESGSERFSQMFNAVLKYTSALACFGGVGLALFGSEILDLFYGKSNPDLAQNGAEILFALAVTVLPCCLASSCVFCSQSLGFSRRTILPFAVSAVLRVGIDLYLVGQNKYNVMGAVISNCAGYLLIFVWNIIIIRRKTGVEFSFADVIFKPVLCGAATYFAVFFMKNEILISKFNLLNLTIYGVICAILFFFMLILFRCIRIRELFGTK